MIDVKKAIEIQESIPGFMPEFKLPSDWELIQESPDGAMYIKAGLKVIISGAVELDGNRWIHLSFSRRSRMPEYKDMKVVKNLFLGDKKAVMVFPEEKEFVNIHKFCLHLWCCLDKDPLPDFTHGVGMI